MISRDKAWKFAHEWLDACNLSALELNKEAVVNLGAATANEALNRVRLHLDTGYAGVRLPFCNAYDAEGDTEILALHVAGEIHEIDGDAAALEAAGLKDKALSELLVLEDCWCEDWHPVLLNIRHCLLELESVYKRYWSINECGCSYIFYIEIITTPIIFTTS